MNVCMIDGLPIEQRWWLWKSRSSSWSWQRDRLVNLSRVDGPSNNQPNALLPSTSQDCCHLLIIMLITIMTMMATMMTMLMSAMITCCAPIPQRRTLPTWSKWSPLRRFPSWSAQRWWQSRWRSGWQQRERWKSWRDLFCGSTREDVSHHGSAVEKNQLSSGFGCYWLLWNFLGFGFSTAGALKIEAFRDPTQPIHPF